MILLMDANAKPPGKGERMDAHCKLLQLNTLLVDDDAIVRDAMKLAFKQKGYALRVAETADEGLHLLRAERFDIIICDFKLYGSNGLEFLKAAVAEQPEAVKLLISAFGDDDVVSQAFSIGVHDFLPKPFSLRTLWATLLMHFERRNGNGKHPGEQLSGLARSAGGMTA